MKRSIDIQEYQQHLEQELRALEAAPIAEDNKQTIREFVQELALEGLTAARQLKYVGWLRRLALRIAKDFKTFTAADCRSLVATFEMEKTRSPWTKADLRIILRRFFAFVHRSPRGQYPDVVAWIKVCVDRRDIMLPGDGDLLAQADISAMITAAMNVRDKAIIATLWESGCRISELGNLQLRHVLFDQFGAQLSVFGKTGARQVRLISSVPFLANWIACHPHQSNRDAPLWTILNRKRMRPLNYGYFRMMVQRLAAQCGIKKRVFPHLFRHSRATHLANHLTEFQMNHYFGWKQGSDMPSTYVHLSGKNLDDALLQLNGHNTRTERSLATEAPICPRCQGTNAAQDQFCRRCGSALDLRAAIEADAHRAGRSSRSDTPTPLRRFMTSF